MMKTEKERSRMQIEITKPETEALIQQHLKSGRFHDVDELLTKALDALEEQPPAAAARQAANLVELSKPVRGLLSDEEVDTIFRRNPSTSRPLDLR
jgi:Arc/MetJ-type ribon-helix-helix transcriptional regulator